MLIILRTFETEHHRVRCGFLLKLWCTQMQQTVRCHSLFSRLNFLIFFHYVSLSFTFKYWVWPSNFNWRLTTEHRLHVNMIKLGKLTVQDICTWGDPKETKLVSMPPNAKEWEKDVSVCSLDPQLSVARRTSSCNNSIGCTVSFREGSFCDHVEIVMCDLKEQRNCLKFASSLGKHPRNH
jgi:hypothetical protein